ncbi:MAG: restriction endonuclease [Thermodesulfobacteriota bacterium]
MKQKTKYTPLKTTVNVKLTLTHDKLITTRVFEGNDIYELYQKALSQAKTWDDLWVGKQASEIEKQEAEMKELDEKKKKQEAELKKQAEEKEIKDYVIRKNIEYQDILNDLRNILKDALDDDSIYDREILTKFSGREPEAILELCKNALNKSKYPIAFPKLFEIEYIKEPKTLVVNYFLPTIDDIPKVIEIKYNKSKKEIQERHLSESERNRLYDNVLYMISLRTTYEIFKGDNSEYIDIVVFNGWIKGIDKSTGKDIQKCILSVQTQKDNFWGINLDKVDPKACFMHLKGVGSSKLHDLIPIAPILDISKDDKRFVSSYDVASSLDESVNIAAMDWLDFEHLIREIFQKEFQQGGGEVKITRASRDAGVDAIAFDPDPIRGGKIVIQAKRYVNIVGVAAVRDLYGTIVNEGATKGILVTTSNYGSDAYEFARGKPITLLTGNNLLHLLEKHGYRAKIDLKEAKQILSKQEN